MRQRVSRHTTTPSSSWSCSGQSATQVAQTLPRAVESVATPPFALVGSMPENRMSLLILPIFPLESLETKGQARHHQFRKWKHPMRSNWRCPLRSRDALCFLVTGQRSDDQLEHQVDHRHNLTVMCGALRLQPMLQPLET